MYFGVLAVKGCMCLYSGLALVLDFRRSFFSVLSGVIKSILFKPFLFILNRKCTIKLVAF